MEKIISSKLGTPRGHYSHATVHGDLIYVSGQVPVDAEGKVQGNDIAEQVQIALEKMETILKEVGSNRNKVLKTTVYILDIAHWGKTNEAYANFFGDHKPARATIPVNGLPGGCLVEIEAIAHK